MQKREFFLSALNALAHYERAMMLTLFNVTRPKKDVEPVPYQLRYNPDSTEAYVGDEWVPIDDVEPMQPVFAPKEPLDLEPGELLSVDRSVETSYGDALFNAYVLIPAFGAKLPYQVGDPYISVPKIERWIADNVLDNPQDEQYDPDQVYIRDYLQYADAIEDLASITQYLVLAVNERSLTTDPRFKELRAELLEKYKDRLHDPATQALIQDALIALDKAWIEADEVKDFYLKEKAFNTARKRMFLIHGPEAGFDEGGNAELVIPSLNEGWTLDQFEHKVNSLRAGSYFRGYLTAMGGESVKFFLRIFQNAKIVPDDCGVTYGWHTTINGDNANAIVGMYQITGKGLTHLDADRVKSLMGQPVEIRSPLFCKAPHGDYCQYCMGSINSSSPTSIGTSASKVGSTFMDVMMASAHAKELKTAPIQFNTFLS